MKSLQTTAHEEKGLQDVAVAATTRLKQALTNEKEVNLRKQAEMEVLQVGSAYSFILEDV